MSSRREVNKLFGDAYGVSLHVVCWPVVYPSRSPDRAFRSLMYGLSFRMRSIRCFWSGKMSYSFRFSSDVSPADRWEGGAGEGDGERRGGCHSGGPECGQCACLVGWAIKEGVGQGVEAEVGGVDRTAWTYTGCCWEDGRESGGLRSGGVAVALLRKMRDEETIVIESKCDG